MENLIIISGAGSGIGKATSLELSKRGGNYLLVGRNLEKLEETAKEMDASAEVSVCSIDLSNEETSLKALKKIATDTKSVKAIIANHGLGGENHFGANDRIKDIFNTNVFGTYNLFNSFLEKMEIYSGPTNVIILSSVLAKIGVPAYSGYCASKAALLGFVKSWAVEHASKNILINGICPGWVDTQMARDGITDFSKVINVDFEKAKSILMEEVPLRKMANPKEIGVFIDFLVFNNLSITGQSLDINNGAYMN